MEEFRVTIKDFFSVESSRYVHHPFTFDWWDGATQLETIRKNSVEKHKKVKINSRVTQNEIFCVLSTFQTAAKFYFNYEKSFRWNKEFVINSQNILPQDAVVCN